MPDRPPFDNGSSLVAMAHQDRKQREHIAELRRALQRAHEQLSRFDYKGPKQVGRAMLTLERALDSLGIGYE